MSDQAQSSFNGDRGRRPWQNQQEGSPPVSPGQSQSGQEDTLPAQSFYAQGWHGEQYIHPMMYMPQPMMMHPPPPFFGMEPNHQFRRPEIAEVVTEEKKNVADIVTDSEAVPQSAPLPQTPSRNAIPVVARKRLAFKDPRTGKEIEISRSNTPAPSGTPAPSNPPPQAQPAVMSSPVLSPAIAPAAPPPSGLPPRPPRSASPVAPPLRSSPALPPLPPPSRPAVSIPGESEEDSSEDVPVKKQLKGIRNLAIPGIKTEMVFTPISSKLAAKRIFNKPLSRPSAAPTPMSSASPLGIFEEKPVAFQFPISRDRMLLFMPLVRPEEVPPCLLSLVVRGKQTATRRGAKPSEGQWARGMPQRRAVGGKASRSAPVVPLKVSETGYKVLSAAQMDAQEILKRQVLAILNKITLDTFSLCTDKIREIPVDESWQTNTIVGLVFDKAVVEHHYSEMYAEMCLRLAKDWPMLKDEEGNPVDFRRQILEKCQDEFERIPATLEPSEEEREKVKNDPADLEILRGKKKERILGNMKFIGQLYLKQLVSTGVAGKVAKRLLGQPVLDEDEEVETPEEHYLECACSFLSGIGNSLEARSRGGEMLDDFLYRLKDLIDTGKYSKRIQFMARDLFEARQAGWKEGKVVGKLQAAKTKEEVRREQQKPPTPVVERSFYKQTPPPVVTRAPARFTAVNPPVIQSRKIPSAPVRIQGSASAPAIRAATSSSSDTDESEVSVTSESSMHSVASFSDRRQSNKQLPTLLPRAADALPEETRNALKRFRDYFAEDGELDSFVDSAEISLNKGGCDWSPLCRLLLDLGSSEPKKASSDSKLLIGLIEKGKVSWVDLSASFCAFFASLEDLAVDVPHCLIFADELVARAIHLDTSQTLEHLLKPALATLDPIFIGNRASGIIFETKKLFGEAVMHKAANLLRDELGRWLTEAEIARALSIEEEDGQMTEDIAIIDELIRSADYSDDRAIEIAKKRKNSTSFVIGRLEHLLRPFKPKAWGAKGTYQDRLTPAKLLLTTLLQDGKSALNHLCKACMFLELKPNDTQQIITAFLNFGIFTPVDAHAVLDAGFSQEKKAAEEPIRNALKDFRKT